jgi:hypothetical protein
MACTLRILVFRKLPRGVFLSCTLLVQIGRHIRSTYNNIRSPYQFRYSNYPRSLRITIGYHFFIYPELMTKELASHVFLPPSSASWAPVLPSIANDAFWSIWLGLKRRESSGSGHELFLSFWASTVSSEADCSEICCKYRNTRGLALRT